jgi:hypothetical protein
MIKYASAEGIPELAAFFISVIAHPTKESEKISASQRVCM